MINMPKLSTSDPRDGALPASFELIKNEFLTPLGMSVSDIARDDEGAEYGAVRFNLDGKPVLFRQAKHTPTKLGQFVTLWKRDSLGSEIAPVDVADGIDRVLVFADERDRFGLFVFRATVLVEKRIFSTHVTDGKRAFRVYAPWTEPVAAQARSTKAWQCNAFVELTDRDVGMAKLGQALK
jgi:hypothetical protein